MERLFWVCIAGGIGAGTRYLVSAWAGQRLGAAFPYGTLIVNVAGCFAIALVMHLAQHLASFPPNLRFALSSGFIGGLTTYSSFNYESTKLWQTGSPRLALLNLVLTLVLCFVAGLLGFALGQRLTR